MSETVKALCSGGCGGLYALTTKGVIRKHQAVNPRIGNYGVSSWHIACPGSGKPPKDGFRVGRFHNWTEGETNA